MEQPSNESNRRNQVDTRLEKDVQQSKTPKAYQREH
ncbi:hypothetical protein NIES2135_14790 [Leptolyngbya boryana NIES-2135]|uniref:Uncharacterized protein n=1 Tax=Leptolyngbya boryana NIES-2135 TaxID=1973484 RepID=A0A1Z4JD51_LEPBY|nr:hypothetical protein NIES2135_14790 [Leptolyngbya boryana NIES-2135]